VKPPSVRNVTNLPLTAGTASGPQPTAVDTAIDRDLAIICNRPFDILFSDDAGATPIPAPANTGTFLAGHIYTFQLGPRNTHFRVVANAAANLKFWRSSRT
jgi:hypothetical protein